ncbi:MAG: hypothetical protein N2234_03580, partial [Planctomycetota bacterium]|nr:hypothetical protein [Planctomycetota bacterium]
MVFWVVVISVAVFVASFLRTHLVADVFTCVFALAALLMHHLIHNERKEVGVTLSLYAGVSVCFGSGLLHWKGKEFDGRIIFVVTLCTVFALYEMVRLVRKAIGGGDSSYENFMKALLLLVCAVLAVSQVIVAPSSAIPVIEKGYAVSLFMVLLPILVKEWRRDGKSLSQKKGTIYFVCFTLLAVCCTGIVEAAILRLQLNSADRDWLLAIVRRSKSDSLSASALRRLLEMEGDEGKMGLLECYGRFLSEEERRRLTKDVGLRIA